MFVTPAGISAVTSEPLFFAQPSGPPRFDPVEMKPTRSVNDRRDGSPLAVVELPHPLTAVTRPTTRIAAVSSR